MKKIIQTIDEDAAEKYATVHYREDSKELYGNITRDFLAGCDYGREQEKKKLEIALEALKESKKLLIHLGAWEDGSYCQPINEALKQIEGKE